MPDAVLEPSGRGGARPAASPCWRPAACARLYGEHVAVDGVDLGVPAGGSLAIVGESGSGKTTVAKMLVGLERPSAGTVRACGRDRSAPARGARERRRRGGEVQIVFQDQYASLDPRQSAEQTLDEVLKLHGDGWAPPRGERGSLSWASWSGSTRGCCGRGRRRSQAASGSGSRSLARWRRRRGS